MIDHLALRGTLKYFEGGNRRLTEEVMTGEVIAYVEAMRNVIRRVQRINSLYVAPRIRILT